MRYTIVLIISLSVFNTSPAMAIGVDYTSRNYTIPSCKLFATEAYHAAYGFQRGVDLTRMLDLVDQANMTDTMKHRSFQAVQFVWKNQIDNPVLAKSIAMGLCLKPKRNMAPMDEPWVTSPRTSKEFY